MNSDFYVRHVHDFYKLKIILFLKKKKKVFMNSDVRVTRNIE